MLNTLKKTTLLALFGILFFLPLIAFGREDPGTTIPTTPQKYGTYNDPFFGCSGTTALECFTENAYAYSLTAIGIIATIMIVFAGLMYMTSGGNPERQGKAKKFIFGALSGVALLVLANTLISILTEFFEGL